MKNELLMKKKVKAVILAGGLGTRLSEETIIKPKPMVEIGGKPILWHIMKIFSTYGVNDFIICCGYKAGFIKNYFRNLQVEQSDFSVNLSNGKLTFHTSDVEDWNVTLVDTGYNTMTGGRLRRVESYLSDNDDFFFTYGDGVADIDIADLYRFHTKHGKAATVTGVRPPARFGMLKLEKDKVVEFSEKPIAGDDFINGGFFVLNKDIFDELSADSDIWEKEPLQSLACRGELMCYKHDGFWQPMDTLREKQELDMLVSSGEAPWVKW